LSLFFGVFALLCFFGDKAFVFYFRGGRLWRYLVCAPQSASLGGSAYLRCFACAPSLARSGIGAVRARVFDRALWLVWYHCFSFSARLTRYRVPAIVT